MRSRAIVFATAFTCSVMPAIADDAEIYKRAYAQGYSDGYAEGNKYIPFGPGTLTIRPPGAQPGTVMIPGSQFDTVIGPSTAGTEFSLPSDSSIAIIPNNALKDIEQKLGGGYIADNNIILNNNLPVQ